MALFAQMTLVGYGKLGFQVGERALRYQGYDTSHVILTDVVMLRDYWWLVWLGLVAVFVLLLRMLVKYGPDWRNTLAVIGVAIVLTMVVGAFSIGGAASGMRKQTFGYRMEYRGGE